MRRAALHSGVLLLLTCNCGRVGFDFLTLGDPQGGRRDRSDASVVTTDRGRDAAPSPQGEPEPDASSGSLNAPGDSSGPPVTTTIDAGVSDSGVSSSPPIEGGLILWLDANNPASMEGGAGLSRWMDLSGRGNHASQDMMAAQPQVVADVLDGKSVVRFDGTDELVGNNTDGEFDTTDFSILMVVSPRWSVDPGVNPCPFAIRGEAGGLSRVSLHVAGDLSRVLSFNGSVQRSSTFAFTTGEFYFIAFVWEAGTESQYINGTLETQFANTVGTSVEQPLRIGAAQTAFESFDGDIAEVFVYERALSPTELDTVEAFVETKWGLALAP